MATLDQVVKGAPAPGTSLDQVAASAGAHTHSPSRSPSPTKNPFASSPAQEDSAYANPPHATAPAHDANDRLAALKTPRPPHLVADPTSLLPSSPPQIYLNLLIMEASLRSQYLTLRARRRQNSFVLSLLSVWILFFSYLLWLRPRDDGNGIGGSQYWLVDTVQKLCFITGVVTALLFWATGQWERGVRWPRRWIAVANRGLRGMNAKIVVLRGPWWQELANWAAFVRPFSGGLWGGETGGSSYHFISLAPADNTSSTNKKSDAVADGRPRHRIVEDGKEYAEEDIAGGGDYIKLLLLPKPFTPDFRENWELYRQEYWERENERRAELRQRVRLRQRQIARDEGGWLWWTGWRGWKRARGIAGRAAADVEKSGHGHAHAAHAHAHAHTLHPRSHSQSHSQSQAQSQALAPRKRRPSTLRGRDTSLSRSSSRSTTPTPDVDDPRLRALDSQSQLQLQSQSRERRWSTSTAGSTTVAAAAAAPRKKPSPASSFSAAPAGVRQVPSSRLAESRSVEGRERERERGEEGVERVEGEGERGVGLGLGQVPVLQDKSGVAVDGSSSSRRRPGSSPREDDVFPNAQSA